MTAALARRLVWEGVAAPAEATAALKAHVRDRVAFLTALVHAHPNLEGPIELELGLARSSLSEAIVVNRELWAALPPGLPETLLAIPVGRDPETGAVRVVAVHHGEGHVEKEIAFHLGADVIVDTAPLGTVLAAIDSVRERSNVRASARTASPSLRITQSLGSPVLASKVRSIPTIAIAAAASPSSVPPPSGEPVITLTRAKSLQPALTTGPTMVFSPHEIRPAGASAAPAPQAVRAAVEKVAPVSIPAPPKAPSVLPALNSSLQARRVQSVFAVTLADGTVPTVATPGAAAEPPLPSQSPDSPRAEEPAPSRREVIDAAALDAALDELDSATTPERVVTILVYAMENVARRVVVFAARSKAYEGRETNHGPSRNAVRALQVPVAADTVLKAAIRTGRYFGPLPPGVANDGLRNVLGDPAEVTVGVVSVQSRPALVYIAAGFDSQRLATRRGEELAKAASLTLERIVRERKK